MGIRVADPWHFCADPDPANQNFKYGSWFGSGSVGKNSDPDSDPDPAKRYGSERIRIRNTAYHI